MATSSSRKSWSPREFWRGGPARPGRQGPPPAPGPRVSLWSARPDNARILRERRENVRLLPGVPIPETVELTEDVRAVAGADLYVAAVPTVYLRSTLQKVASSLRPDRPVVSLAK